MENAAAFVKTRNEVIRAMSPEPLLDGHDNVFEDLNRLQSILGDLDERGLVLSLAAFAEDALGDLIAAFLIQGDQADSLLTGFNAPLGTLSARLKMAFALGLINQNQYDDLDRLRKIRNAFAHDWRPTSLSDQAIASHVSALNFGSLSETYPETPIAKVRSSIGDVLVELRSATHQISKHDKGAKLLGGHLLALLTGSLEDQVAKGQQRLNEIEAELSKASGDRARFLRAAHARWTTKYKLAHLTLIEASIAERARSERHSEL